MSRIVVLIGLSVSLLGCNLADDTLRGVIGDASSGGFAVPPTPTGWSFKIYRNGVTTNDSSPVISGSLSSDYDGYKAKVYSDAGCSDQLGSATIASGAFEISDISLGTFLKKYPPFGPEEETRMPLSTSFLIILAK